MKNFIIRTLSGFAFTVLVIGAILYGPIAFAVVFGAIMLIAVNEFLNITVLPAKGRSISVAKVFTMAAAAMLFANMMCVTAYGMDPLYLLFAVLPIIGIFISNMYVKQYNVHTRETVEGEERRIPNGYEMFPFYITSLVYIALPFSLMPLVLYDKTGIYDGNLLLSMLILLWCTDVGAYLLGSTLGQMNNHRLFLSISPKKSWEGFFGGLILAVAGAIALRAIGLLDLSMIDAIVVGVIICVFGVVGDLVESQLKRNFGVKDSGSIMPGHGGMLDRFDSMSFAAPTMWVLVTLLPAI
jgi:phosphatidate cytidylyltransferase